MVLTEDLIDNFPPYAILSHTWGADDTEVTFTDVIERRYSHKNGFRKLKFCSEKAKIDRLDYFWIDTCCINKSSSSELQEAITSMFHWYQNSARCYVYLSDVEAGCSDPIAWDRAFESSRWFTRGWTLQELLAPSSVEFFSVEGKRLGDKGTLVNTIHKITNIDRDALRGRELSSFSVAERGSWCIGRNTKRKEDKAYCLLGIFGVSMFLNYGEGEHHAMKRLQTEIQRCFRSPGGSVKPGGYFVATNSCIRGSV
jgi:hypothetical protein